MASSKELTKTILWRKDFCNYYFNWCIFPTAEHQQTILFLLQTTLTFRLVDVNMLVNQTITLKANHQIQKEVSFFTRQQYAIDSKENHKTDCITYKTGYRAEFICHWHPIRAKLVQDVLNTNRRHVWQNQIS